MFDNVHTTVALCKWSEQCFKKNKNNQLVMTEVGDFCV